LAIALICVAIVAACIGIESLLDRPWVYAVGVVHTVASLAALANLIGAALGPRLMAMDDDDPRPTDVG